VPIRIRTALKVVVPIMAATVLVSVAAFVWLKPAPRHVPTGQPPLAMLDARSLPAFRNAFNASEGEVRVLAMLSPT
jgi:hypothetical protein